MLFKIIGLVISVACFITAGYWLVTGQLHNNLMGIGFIVALNLFLSLGLPRLFPNNPNVTELRTGSHILIRFVNDIVVGIALIIVYIIGVGFVWFFSRIAGKKFLNLSNKGSTWEKYVPTGSDEMF